MSDHQYPPRYVRRPRKTRRCPECGSQDGPRVRFSCVSDGMHQTLYLCIPCARTWEQAVNWRNVDEGIMPGELVYEVDCGGYCGLDHDAYLCGAHDHPAPAVCAACEHGANVKLKPLDCEPEDER